VNQQNNLFKRALSKNNDSDNILPNVASILANQNNHMSSTSPRLNEEVRSGGFTSGIKNPVIKAQFIRKIAKQEESKKNASKKL
jgi:hypothetical protein